MESDSRRPTGGYSRWEVTAKLWQAAAGVGAAHDFFTTALPLLLPVMDAESAAVYQGEKGVWRIVAGTPSATPAPVDLLAEALDADGAREQDRWMAAALTCENGGEVLVVKRRGGATGQGVDFLWLAAELQKSLTLVRERQMQARRLARLQAILDIAAQWQQTQELGPLLTNMAEASTRLLQCERASIFLWDRANRTLVGRPALGVVGGELRIAEDAGVVGQVVQTGEPRRVDEDIEREQREVFRAVDQQLKFHTRSLLCVPLRGKRGEICGAFEVLNKRAGNFTAEDETALAELAAHAGLALENTRQLDQLLTARKQLADHAAQGVQLIGGCPAIAALRSALGRIADTDLAALILGENGTGKEVIAQLIHYQSRRRQEPFIAVNCAALTESLLESELFGHEKGAFTDARETRPGKFELAAGGTLFLDEIGDMSLGGQAKLLRVLEEKLIVRVGGSATIPVQARLLAATNQNLGELVRAKRFREDLFYRLSVVTLELPPLRARGEDIPLLAEHFLRHYCAIARRPKLTFTAAARTRLLAHGWPGNVRELKNLAERLAYLSPEGQIQIDAADLTFILSPGASGAHVLAAEGPLVEATRAFQRDYITRQLDASGGNMTVAATKLGLHRSNLYRKMRQLGMEAEE